MTIDYQIRDEKLQVDINRKQEKYLQYHKLINILINGKTDKYEYITGKVEMSSDQIQIIEEDKFIYPTLKKALEEGKKKEKEASLLLWLL